MANDLVWTKKRLGAFIELACLSEGEMDVYSDYGKTAAKHNMDKTDFWADMADDFIDDMDAEPDKIGRYWRDIVRHKE